MSEYAPTKPPVVGVVPQTTVRGPAGSMMSRSGGKEREFSDVYHLRLTTGYAVCNYFSAKALGKRLR